MATPAIAPLVLLEAALADLGAAVSFSTAEAPSHTVVVVDGLDEPCVPVALGRYLVGALAGAVDVDARLCADLLAQGTDRRAEINATVLDIIGTTNVFGTSAAEMFRDTRRNAWIGEGVGHALLMLAAKEESSVVNGRICTVSEVHQSPTRQGLDSVSAYEKGGALGVAIGESKATRSGGSAQLGEAARMFTEVDNGVYGPDLRARLAAFRGFLPPALTVQVSDSLWTDNGCYLPMIVHQDAFDAMANRPTLSRLAPPIERRRVVVMQLTDFHAFFDGVADAMRAAVPEVVI